MEMNAIYRKRRGRFYNWMEEHGIGVVVLQDNEERRDASLRYLCGHPMDALLFLFAGTREAALVPWDALMARQWASVDRVVPYGDYKRSFADAVCALTAEVPGALELPAALPHPLFQQLEERLPKRELLCREEGAGTALVAQRAVKDESEIALFREAAAATNLLLDELEEQLRAGALASEMDVAFFLETRGRALGAEGTGFETLAAGPGRSWGIHCFPSYGSGPFAGPGLSILDFGLRFQGYSTDVTMTAAREPLSARQREMVTLVQEAHEKAAGMLRPGIGADLPARAVEEFFAAAGYTMPHSLGHGLGLEVHEGPTLRTTGDNHPQLEAGMVVTIEPGLYDPDNGGVRLEDDYLITPEGFEKLTRSRILFLQA